MIKELLTKQSILTYLLTAHNGYPVMEASPEIYKLALVCIKTAAGSYWRKALLIGVMRYLIN